MFGNVWRTCGVGGRGSTSIGRVKIRDACKRPTVRRTKNYPAQTPVVLSSRDLPTGSCHNEAPAGPPSQPKARLREGTGRRHALAGLTER